MSAPHPERQVIRRRGAYTRRASLAMAAAILSTRPPRARRTAWRLARSFMVTLAAGGELGALGAVLRAHVGDHDGEAAITAARNAMNAASWGLMAHPTEGTTALALVQCLTGEPADTLAGCADDGTYYRRLARWCLSALAGLEPPRA